MENTVELTNDIKPKRKRIIELDMVKGLIIISVMMKHLNLLLGLSETNPHLDYAFAWMFEIFMAAFFVISGYVYTSKGSVGSQIAKRIKQLLFPLLFAFCFNTFVYAIRYLLIERVSLNWFLEKISLSLLGFAERSFFIPNPTGPNYLIMGFSPYWFVFQMIPAFIIFILVKALGDKKGFAFRCLLASILILIALTIHYFDFQHTLKDTMLSPIPFYFVLDNVIGFAGVMMLGSLLKEKNIFDIDSFDKKVTFTAFIICLTIMTIISINYNPNDYTLLYGRWGQYGAWSVIITTFGGVLLTYCLVYLQHFLKRITPIKKALIFLGQNSLTYLLLHFIIGETLCYIGGFWYPIYAEPYPIEKFSYLKWIIVVALTLVICTGYIMLKNMLKSKMATKRAKQK